MAATHAITPLRLEPHYLDLIERLKAALHPKDTGRGLSRADVVRQALTALAAQVLHGEPVATGQKKKKKDKN